MNAVLEKMLENAKTAQYTRGENRLLHEYAKSQRDYGQLVIDGICWEDDMDDMIALIRKAGIETIIVADHSTALLGLLHSFLQAGFKVKGAVMLEKTEPDSWDKPVKALEIEVA